MLEMEMFGAALATGFSAVCGLLVVSSFFIRKKNNFRPVSGGISMRIAGGIFSTGLPSFITEVSAGVVMFVFNMIILGLQGNIGLAAYGVIANISIILLAICTGTAQGIQPLNARNIRHYAATAPASQFPVLEILLNYHFTAPFFI
jgi:Na+-driven multidrug efflux pump